MRCWSLPVTWFSASFTRASQEVERSPYLVSAPWMATMDNLHKDNKHNQLFCMTSFRLDTIKLWRSTYPDHGWVGAIHHITQRMGLSFFDVPGKKHQFYQFSGNLRIVQRGIFLIDMDPVDPSIAISDMSDGRLVSKGPLRRLDPPGLEEVDGVIIVLPGVPTNRVEAGCIGDVAWEVAYKGGHPCPLG